MRYQRDETMNSRWDQYRSLTLEEVEETLGSLTLDLRADMTVLLSGGPK